MFFRQSAEIRHDPLHLSVHIFLLRRRSLYPVLPAMVLPVLDGQIRGWSLCFTVDGKTHTAL